MSSTPNENLSRLRAAMAEHELDAYIVPSADPHQTEYTHPHWRCRAWLSGFTGSVGTVVALAEKAGLWADGRYYIQAEKELSGSGIDLFKFGLDGVPALMDWVRDEIPEGGRVGVDGRLITAKQRELWAEKCAAKNATLVTDLDLIGPLWSDRPALPDAPAKRWSLEYAGRSAADKLREIREEMEKRNAEVYVISSIYDINWLFNVRGGDTAHTPLLTAYAIVERDRCRLFVDERKVAGALREELLKEGVETAPYDAFFAELAEIPATSKVYLCADRVSALARETVQGEVIEGPDLTDLPKARKNAVELANWKLTHVRDGASMVRFLKELEEQNREGGWDEVDAADALERIRRADETCLDLSFSSISAYGGNAAMMHYFPTREICAPLEPRGLYLIDSGGQYLGGTTDITRTVALGPLTEEEREDYTLVLKGVINLSTARFLKGAAGNNLDVLARQALWARGMDYKCGTGHGVGCYLNVHEGPHNISPAKRSDTPFEPGMVVTIEPGVYKEGRHGIRIENMVVVEMDQETESGVFYRFGTQTLCPIDTTPLTAALLSDAEIEWLNAYHAEVLERLSPALNVEETEWLAEKTRPFTRD